MANEVQHTPRWIRASIAEYFSDNKGTYDYFVEGQDRDTDAWIAWAELRMDGPDRQQHSKDEYTFSVEVNVLCMTVMDSSDLYKQDRLVGHFAVLYINIPIYKYGDGGDDDGTLLGCLRLKEDGKEKVSISHFGQLRPDTRVMQSTLEGHYELCLKV